jgi:hypothetical protein
MTPQYVIWSYEQEDKMTAKRDSHYCKCEVPKRKTVYDDKGRKVVYCDNCWKPLRQGG